VIISLGLIGYEQIAVRKRRGWWHVSEFICYMQSTITLVQENLEWCVLYSAADFNARLSFSCWDCCCCCCCFT